MLKKVFLGLVLVVAIIIVAGLLLGLNMLRVTQQQIDGLNPELPTYQEIMAAAREADLPTSIHILNTASQSIARHLILDAELDPASSGNVELAFPAFVLTWANGHRFVVDGGLSATEADRFGRQLQWLGDGFHSEPMVYHRSLSASLYPVSVKGLGLTHLHPDHTTGFDDLCAAGARYTTYQSIEQFTGQNYSTFRGDDELAAMTCSIRLVLAQQETLLRDIQGFPGLYVVHVAGHTPGSQVFIAHVRQPAGVKTYIIGGDIANHGDAVTFNIGKPSWYSRWVISENIAQLERLRRWLKSLSDRNQIQVLLSHDLQALQNSGVPALD